MTTRVKSRFIEPVRRRFLRYSGLAARQWRHLPDGLYVFTFHRIGDARTTPFDPNVFSCDVPAFERHIVQICANFTVIRPSELDEIENWGPGRYALLTFDDGYRDNLERAVPILARRQLEAVLFVATGMIGSDTPPWWDAVAYMVGHAQRSSARIGETVVQLEKRRLQATIREVLRVFKSTNLPIDEKLRELESSLNPASPLPSERLIMNWSELREAQARGMTIGSHTVNHPLLAHLDVKQQRYELQQSRKQLEERLQCAINMVAYPVGGSHAFTEQTTKLAEDAGYRYGFTNIPQRNELNALDRFTLGRVGVGSASTRELQLQTCLHC
jgi:peptidoglycan/xylan/chitin deacetylase (PgdA/CDA1 family)